MTVVLAAHGTRDPAGVAVAHQLANALRARLAGRPVLAQDSRRYDPGVN
jgi:sirohydrochlorin ferrochelatase